MPTRSPARAAPADDDAGLWDSFRRRPDGDPRGPAHRRPAGRGRRGAGVRAAPAAPSGDQALPPAGGPGVPRRPRGLARSPRPTRLAQRVRAGTAWPAATVVEPATPVQVATSRPVGAGVLLPRAPRRFALRHRDGTTRLATLSYLTADPAHRAVAYGLSLPDPVSPERLGLVYALARVLEAFETADPPGRSWRPVDQERAVVAAARPGGVRPRLRQLRALRPGRPAADACGPAAGHDAQLGRPGGRGGRQSRPWRRTATRWPDLPAGGRCRQLPDPGPPAAGRARSRSTSPCRPAASVRPCSGPGAACGTCASGA